jgi:2-polyprenyl-3-methyl-5-hydroxy-6-metoxy-1,4-benzoquinol methylase
MKFNAANKTLVSKNMFININNSPATGRPPFPIRAIRKLWRLALDAPYRNMMWLYWARPKAAFQPFNDTQFDRYPQIFAFVQSALGRESAIDILSYGCSTGDEVFSLRRYFPRAVIKGIDINPANIAVCRRRLNKSPDANISFNTARCTAAEPSGSYDAIFCMAVLRHGRLGLPGVIRCDHLIRFEDFAHAVADFERCLKPGGLLVIRHSNFRLCDAAVGQAFETILQLPHNSKTPLFGPDNRLLPEQTYPDTVFRKKLNA